VDGRKISDVEYITATSQTVSSQTRLTVEFLWNKLSKKRCILLI